MPWYERREIRRRRRRIRKFLNAMKVGVGEVFAVVSTFVLIFGALPMLVASIA